jgi:hypothetical protein
MGMLAWAVGAKRNAKVPPGNAGSDGEQHGSLEFRKRQGWMVGLEGKRPRRDLHPQSKPAGATSKDGCQQWVSEQIVQWNVVAHGVGF